VAGAAIALLLAAACSGSGSDETASPSPKSPTPSTVSPTPQPTDPRLHGTSEVRFPSEDGVELRGRLFGSGGKVVLLSMMGIPAAAQTDWLPLARTLAGHGYRVVSYNYRGACNAYVLIDCSEGDYDLTHAEDDLLGAIELARALEGFDSLTLVGADLGATVSLDVASRPGEDFAGIVSLSGVEAAQGYDVGRDVIQAVDEPKLFVVGRADEDRVPTFRHWVAWSGSSGRELTFDTQLRGTFMLAPIAPQDQGIPAKLSRTVLDFLQRYA
jgi:pimeloyl-ACP methyl ester carboxylesterase